VLDAVMDWVFDIKNPEPTKVGWYALQLNWEDETEPTAHVAFWDGTAWREGDKTDSGHLGQSLTIAAAYFPECFATEGEAETAANRRVGAIMSGKLQK
jgi:hypothetical protein